MSYGFCLTLKSQILVEKDRYKSMFQSKVISAMMELCLLNQTGEKAVREGFLKEVIADWSFKGWIGIGQRRPNEVGSIPGKRIHIWEGIMQRKNGNQSRVGVKDMSGPIKLRNGQDLTLKDFVGSRWSVSNVPYRQWEAMEEFISRKVIGDLGLNYYKFCLVGPSRKRDMMV